MPSAIENDTMLSLDAELLLHICDRVATPPGLAGSRQRYRMLSRR